MVERVEIVLYQGMRLIDAIVVEADKVRISFTL